MGSVESDDSSSSDDESEIDAPIPSPLSMASSSSSDDDTMCNETESDAGDAESDLLNLSLTTTEEEETTASATPWCGFKIVGDNWDLNVHPSFQRSDAGTRSLHHFHSFAVRDRVDFSHLSDEDPDLSTVINKINAKQFIPDADDRKVILEEFEIFISRYILLMRACICA